jgi:GNAT superfamily N-acetyltransferase
MGVLRGCQRHGVGRGLVEAAVSHARAGGFRYLTVKTLAPSHPDPGYAATRAFYTAMGFSPLEELPTLWGAGNPALIMIQDVSPEVSQRDRGG